MSNRPPWTPDPSRPNGPDGIYPYIVRNCPHQGCDWEITEEYRAKSALSWRFKIPFDQLEKIIHEHLETHLDPTLKELNL